MSDIVIQVENLSKRYVLSHQSKRVGDSDSIKGLITRAVQAPFRRLHGPHDPEPTHEEFWALKDVSFEVKQGEVIGIIGRNGAGKSTLLKILSRITEPTSGRAVINGRVASLLEVGTGFHPDLTGRENVYLNGAILGMRQTEIKKVFDEIVAFAEVEKFLDTPVKHYSSGMYVRLAFAVAAHLEPEILIVDEVLAVGDAQFQKKCMGKMQEVSRKDGRTVVFVSHNTHAISQLCGSAIMLQNGILTLHGDTSSVLEKYLSSNTGESPEAIWSSEKAPATRSVKLLSVQVLNERDEISHGFDLNDPIILKTKFCIQQKIRMTVSFHLFNQQGINLFATGNLHDPVWGKHEYETGTYEASCKIPAHYLNEGLHHVSIYFSSGENASNVEIHLPEVVSLDVQDSGKSRGSFTGTWLGAVRPLLPWSGKRVNAAI